MERQNKKLLSVPFSFLELLFSGPSSFKFAMCDLIFGDKDLYGQTTFCYFLVFKLTV